MLYVNDKKYKENYYKINQGIGALYIKKDPKVQIKPLI